MNQAAKAIGSAVTIVLLLLAVYHAAYLALSSANFSGHFAFGRYRLFRWQWQADLFRPAAKLESAIRGFDIQTVAWRDDERLGIELDE